MRNRHPLRAFLLLPLQDKWLVVQTIVIILLVKGGLRTLRFHTFRRFFARLVNNVPCREYPDLEMIGKAVWAVNACTQHCPLWGTCLVRALAAKLVLALYGHETVLHIGVQLPTLGALQAHAWLTSHDEIIIGEMQSDPYTPLWVWQTSDDV
jgi:Transglutaminase-like superfamily